MLKDDVKQVWEWLKRFGTEDEKKRLRPVAKYISELEHAVKRLEHDLAHLKQGKLIPQFNEAQFHIDPTAVKTCSWDPPPRVFAPLAERLASMEYRGEIDSDNWERTLRYNSLTQEQALDLIKKYRESKK
tara:strand:- start:134 stop:523 length:390 start_codon:yes stop_codon:yes gene_type:complete